MKQTNYDGLKSIETICYRASALEYISAFFHRSVQTKFATMANTCHQVCLQFVFAVKYRNAVLHKSWRSRFFRVMGNLIAATGCKNFIVNGVEDHVHCFVGLKPAISMSDLMKEVKAKSSKHINDHLLTPEKFEWQRGFGVFSYSQSAVEDVYHYILNQEAHHAKQNFRDEYLELLQEFHVEYDEQYLFEDLI